MDNANPPLADLLEKNLLARFGTILIGGDDLRRALGYPSQDALRQAITRKKVPIPLFKVANRRGQFALIRDVAEWAAQLRESATHDPSLTR